MSGGAQGPRGPAAAVGADVVQAVAQELHKRGEFAHCVRVDDRYRCPDDGARLPQQLPPAHALPEGLRVGAFVRVQSETHSGPCGTPIIDLFRVELAVLHSRAVYAVLRWFATHLDVVGIGPARLARTTFFKMVTLDELVRIWHGTIALEQWQRSGASAVLAAALDPQQPADDYVVDLLATREQLGAAGLVFDEEFWLPETYVRWWLANPARCYATLVSSCAANGSFVRHLRRLVYAARKQLIPQHRHPVAEREVAAAAAQEHGHDADNGNKCAREGSRGAAKQEEPEDSAFLRDARGAKQAEAT
eukprot:m51a1_g13650 hypothetical protein (305) ;mRNA; r:624-1897